MNMGKDLNTDIMMKVAIKTIKHLHKLLYWSIGINVVLIGLVIYILIK